MTKGGNRSSIMCKNKLKHRSLVFLGRKKPRNIRTQWIYAQAGRIVKLGATPEVDEKVIRRKSKTDGKKQFCQSKKSIMTTLIKLSNQTLRFLHSSYDVSLTRQIISFRKFSIAMAPLLRQPSLIPYKRNIPGWGEPMKLYVLSGPKETKRICLMLDPERFPYIVTWPSICLMHAEEVDGRWSWRSMAQRYQTLNVLTISLNWHLLIPIINDILQCKSRV